MQHGHDDLCRRAPLFGVNVDRNAATVVTHCDGLVGVDDHLHAVTMTRQCLVDCVVDDFKNHVMQAGPVIGVTDVHARALTHRVKSLQDLDFTGIVDFVLRHDRSRCSSLYYSS